MNSGFFWAVVKPPLRRHFSSVIRFEGSSEDICHNILNKLWNGRFYQTGLGHFDYFWIRDFGVVIKALISLGEKEKVTKTLKWAIGHYIKSGKVTLCIDKKGRTFDSPEESIDALPWLVYSLVEANYRLDFDEKVFLEEEIKRYCDKYLEKNSGEIKTNHSYSELRDAVDYRLSSYAITMVFLLAVKCKDLGLKNFPYLSEQYRKVLVEKYWNGKYFNADLGSRAFSAESNLLPFYIGLLTDARMLDSILLTIEKKKIDQPIPMKYTDQAGKFRYHWWGRVIMPNYAGSTIWTWMGVVYLNLLYQAKDKRFTDCYQRFKTMIEKEKNLPELLDSNGSWYRKPFYKAEEGMIWAALFLDLTKKY